MEKRRVVSRKVIGSANPIAKKFRDIKNSFAGIGCGFIAIIIGFGLVYASVKSVKEHSKVVAKLPLQKASEVENTKGMVKIKGKPTISNQNNFTYKKCGENNCNEENIQEEELLDSLYYNALFERYELVKETKTETRTTIENGQEVEYTEEITEYVEKWVEKDNKSAWSDFKLGEIKIIPQNSKLVFDYQKKEIPNIYIPNLEPINTYGQQTTSKVGSTRLVINYINNSDEIIVVGNLENKSISGGESFIITNKTNEALTTSLKQEEKFMKIALLFGAWLLLTIGFSAIIAPVMEIVEIIPVVGNLAKLLAGIVGALLSAFIVISLWLFFKFWYLICGFIILIIGILIYLIISQKKKQ